AAEVDNPMQWAVCTARSLGDEFVWDNLLTDERLDENGEFRRLLQEAPNILQNSACLGWIAEEDELVDDVDGFGDRIQAVLEEICEMTRDMTHGEYREYNSRTAFRTKILTESLGVIGVMTRLLDFAGVDILRIGRMPRFKSDFADEKLSAIAKFVGINSAIASKYGMASVFRQLFENRDEVLRWSLDVDVNAAEPFGELIGSWCLFGDYGDRQDVFAEKLRSNVSPRDIRDDAPEIGVRVPVQTSTSRAQYRDLLEEALEAKNLLTTPEAVSVLHGLCRSPLAIANGVARALEPEAETRHIRSVELRRIIAALSPEQVLRDASSTPRKALVALAGAEEFLTQSVLAERAGVSARSLRDHLPDLVDAGIVAEVDAGYRLQLSFAETDRDDGELPERYQDIYPRWVSDPTVSNDVHAAAGALRTAREHHGPDGPISPEEAGFAGDVLLELTEPWPLLDEVLPALWAVTTRACYREDAAVAGGVLVECETEVMGRRPRQLSLQEATTGELVG
ncbi:ArsR family transcriptional regulator, partial [Haloplanus ruber]